MNRTNETPSRIMYAAPMNPKKKGSILDVVQVYKVYVYKRIEPPTNSRKRLLMAVGAPFFILFYFSPFPVLVGVIRAFNSACM